MTEHACIFIQFLSNFLILRKQNTQQLLTVVIRRQTLTGSVTVQISVQMLEAYLKSCTMLAGPEVAYPAHR